MSGAPRKVPPPPSPPPPIPPPYPPLARLLPIAILRILKEKPLHGYQIAEELNKLLGYEVARPLVYMTLRRMEEQGLLVSRWEVSEKGPARRIYHVTEEGLEFFSRTIKELKLLKRLLDILIEEEVSRDL